MLILLRGGEAPKQSYAARPKQYLLLLRGKNQDKAVKSLSVGLETKRLKVIDHVSKHNNASTILKSAIHKKFIGIKDDMTIDAPRHRTWNMVLTTDFEEIDRGYVCL
ncbi:hypothetical protein Tco_0664761 [Tanacetum coccineum]